MSPRTLLTLSILTFALAVAARAGDLDAPASKSATVRSEIARGYAAALTAAAAGGATDLDAFVEVSKKNEQAGTDTDPFYLGLCFGEWRSFWTTLNLGAAFVGTGRERRDDSDLVATYAVGAHQGFRDRAKKLGLADGQLKEVFGIAYDPAEDEPAFENALKTSHFKGSLPKR